jgi:predicted permease
VAAFSTAFVGSDFGDGPRRTLVSAVTADYFHLFGVPLTLGRPFTIEEARAGADIRVAVLSYSAWQQRGADPNILGRPMRINGETFSIIGVASRGFTGTSIPGPDLWVPFGVQRTVAATDKASVGRQLDAREVHDLTVVGRLRGGTSVESAAPVIAAIGRRLEMAYPAVNSGYTLEVSTPSRLAFMPGPGSSALTATFAFLLMLMPAIVLLVACLNLVDLLLARGQMRRQEIAIRSSLGGSRRRLARQLLTEGLLLALAGAVVGLLLSKWATGALMASLRPVLPVSISLPELGLDWRVLVGTLAFSLAATLIFGVWPAKMITSRAAASDLMRHVRDVGLRRSGRGKEALVVSQVALSLLLLEAGGLFLTSARSAASADPGFRLDGGILAEIDPSLAGYDEARGRAVHLALVDRLRTTPGVEAVTIGSGFPFTGFGDSRLVIPAGVNGRSHSVDATFTAVGRDYARVLGLPMLGGRDFTESELAPGSRAQVAIVSDALAQRLWPGEAALGRLIQFVDGDDKATGQPMQIVGIVPAVKHSLGNPRPSPHVYVPLGQHYESAMTVQLRVATAAREQDMLETVARVMHSVDDRVPVVRLETWRTHLDGGIDVWLYRAAATVFSAFGAIALLLAVIGIYGVKSYVVSRRTREFGIRIAVGAQPRAVLWQVLREGGRITAVGIVIGLLLALGAGQIFHGILYGVDAVEPLVFVSAPLILLASSLLAAYLPALRATKVDPTVALRSE